MKKDCKNRNITGPNNGSFHIPGGPSLVAPVEQKRFPLIPNLPEEALAKNVLLLIALLSTRKKQSRIFIRRTLNIPAIIHQILRFDNLGKMTWQRRQFAFQPDRAWCRNPGNSQLSGANECREASTSFSTAHLIHPATYLEKASDRLGLFPLLSMPPLWNRLNKGQAPS
jgi:hypothetical protein